MWIWFVEHDTLKQEGLVLGRGAMQHKHMMQPRSDMCGLRAAMDDGHGGTWGGKSEYVSIKGGLDQGMRVAGLHHRPCFPCRIALPCFDYLYPTSE